MVNTTEGARRAGKEAEKAMPGSHWVETLGRVGYAAKGMVYAVVGIFAMRAAYDFGAEAKGPQEALQELAAQPFGTALLAIAGLGLLCYGLWRFILATLDPKDLGIGAKSLVKRAGYAGSGFANTSLSLAAFQIILGMHGGGDDTQEQWVAEFVVHPIGQALVVGAGVVMIGVALHHAWRAYDGSFVKKFGSGISRKLQTIARRVGRVGLSARAVAFAIIGVFLITAAWRQDPDEAGDMGDAMEAMQQDLGPYIFGIVAVGFICYGAYCWFYARYRDFETDV